MNMEKTISKQKKILIVAGSEDVLSTVRLLAALMRDIEATNFVKMKYKLDGCYYELRLNKLKNL